MTRPGLSLLVLTALMLAGCDRQTPTAPTVQTPSPSAEQTARDAQAAADAKVAADAKAAADAKIAADAKVAAAAKIAADQAAQDARIAADAKKAADLQAAEAARVVALAQENAAKADSLLEMLWQQINDNKLELAQMTFKQLDGMKGQLPAGLQDKIEAAHMALNAKQAATEILK